MTYGRPIATSGRHTVPGLILVYIVLPLMVQVSFPILFKHIKATTTLSVTSQMTL